MASRNLYRPPREHVSRSASTIDPEDGQRFANRATALGLTALCSAACSLAWAVGLGWLTRGRGSEVGQLTYPALFAALALLLFVCTQQLAPSLPRRARLPVLLVLIASTIAFPVTAAMHRGLVAF